MAASKTMGKDDRARIWSFILYPESAPENWRSILDDQHVQWVESPLHNMDADPDTGELKKEHFHIMVMFDGKKSYSQIKEITDSLNATIPQKVASAKGLVRYMIHLDNPEKYQYNKSGIIEHGGADVSEYLKPADATRYHFIAEMRQWVEAENCMEFFTLFDFAAVERFDDWFPLLCDNSSYVMGEYIKSRRNRKMVDIVEKCKENTENPK